MIDRTWDLNVPSGRDERSDEHSTRCRELAAQIRKVLNGYPYGDGNPWPLDLLSSAASMLDERMLHRVEELPQERAQGRLEGIDEAAIIFDKRAEIHAANAVWMGPQRQRYEGARRDGVEMSPMNGPALSHDKALSDAAEIRALGAEQTQAPDTRSKGTTESP